MMFSVICDSDKFLTTKTSLIKDKLKTGNVIDTSKKISWNLHFYLL